MVGALARFNLNSKQLHPLAKEIANMFGLKPISYNPFMNTIAQVIEFVHNIEDSIKIIDQLVEDVIDDTEKPEKINVLPILISHDANLKEIAVDLKETLINNKKPNNPYLYHKYDTHWNKVGAYYGYRHLIETIGKDQRDERSNLFIYPTIPYPSAF